MPNSLLGQWPSYQFLQSLLPEVSQDGQQGECWKDEALGETTIPIKMIFMNQQNLLRRIDVHQGHLGDRAAQGVADGKKGKVVCEDSLMHQCLTHQIRLRMRLPPEKVDEDLIDPKFNAK
jgi:hypothetical protein